ncbi:MAG: peptidylprolyl isomerase [Bacteroidales bacterium]|nr:peptidylprolyl isomerase [Bacteroidales bacterium]
MTRSNSKLFSTASLITIGGILMLFFIFPANTFAQETSTNNSEKQPQGKIIDQVVAVVGNSEILESDLVNQYLNYRMQGNIQGTEQQMKCSILESLLYSKLMLAQAQFDSLTVDETQVTAELEARLSSVINQFGSQEAMEKYYGKSMEDIKSELHDIIKDQLLSQQVQQKVISNVTVTPSEVADYYKSLPKDSIPLIKTEYVIRQIVLSPPITVEERLKVKKELLELRKRILNGESFSTMAILYSEDPGSAKKGGELGFYGKGQLYPQFEAAAEKLKPGQISDVVETKAGYHIIQMIAKKGNYINVRHILLIPKVSPLALQNARNKLDSIAKLIRSDSMSFDEAVKKFSQGPNKNSGGYLLNQQTGGIEFEGEQLDPQVSFTINNMKQGEISNAVPFKTDDNQDAYRILYLEKKIEPHRANLKMDYNKIEQWALMAKQQKIIDNWINDKAQNTYIRINKAYQSCDFKHHWLKEKK